jgi:hypothetical protein
MALLKADPQAQWEALSVKLCKARRRDYELAVEIYAIENKKSGTINRKAAASLYAEPARLASEMEAIEREQRPITLPPAAALTPQEVRAQMFGAMLSPPPHRGGSAEDLAAARKRYNELVNAHALMRATHGATAALKLEPEITRQAMIVHALEGNITVPTYSPVFTRSDFAKLRSELGLR